ncbi:MAG TPA: PAS domain-containing sensor histidine kinase [Streptosporangiaceae bacterium]|jgi:PAS domain S-box-containing protein
MSREPRQGTAAGGQPSARARASLLEYAASLLPAGEAEDAIARLLERLATEFGAEGALVLTPGSAGPLGEHAVYPREISNDVVLLSQLRSAWAEHGGRAASSGHAFQVDLDSGQHRVGLLVAPAEPVLGRRPCAVALLGDVARWKPAARTTLKALATMMASLLDVGTVAPPLAEERPWPDWASEERARPEGTRPGLRLIRPGLQFPSPQSAGVQPPAAGAPGRPAPAGPPGRRGSAVPSARGVPASSSAGPARHTARPAVPARKPRGDQVPEPEGGFPLDTGLVASALVAGAPSAIVAVDSSRRIREFNPAAEELFGRSRAEALGLDMPEALVPERYRQMFVDAMAGYLATGDPTAVSQKVRLRALSADGTERPIELTPMPVTVAGETYFFGFIRDASDVESAGLAVAEGDARFRLLSDLAPVGIMQTDIAGVCSFVNDKWCEMSGMATGEVLGRNWRSTINPSDVKRIDAIRGKATTGPEVATDCRLKTASGREIWVHAVVRRVLDQYGNLVGRVAALTDVNERKHTEAAREQDRRRLVEQNVELRDLNETRVRYLATVSHELRTPLTSIVSFSDLIRSEAGELGSDAGEYLDIVQRNAERLLRVVGDLLDLSSLEEGVARLDLAPVSVPMLARESVRTGWSIAAVDGIRLDIDATDGPEVRADGSRMQQVLDNLISNAVKFSASGGRVEVKASHDDREWRIDVTDAGIGIPAEELSHLFDRFFRASNARESEVPGTGLGLPTAKAITELHGGRIEVVSTMGSGTTFTVYLPIEP